jgi:hypothetical protein
MVYPCPSASNNSGNNCVASYHSHLLLPQLRQISSLILLMSVICAPISGIAQSKEQEKRGIGVTSAPKQTPASVTPATPGDKPELILQTGHTRSANAVAFSPDNRWLASGGVVSRSGSPATMKGMKPFLPSRLSWANTSGMRLNTDPDSK